MCIRDRYEHAVSADDGTVNKITDFVDADLPCFVRSMHTSAPMELCINMLEDSIVTDNSNLYTKMGFTTGLLLGFPAGRYIYNDHPPVSYTHLDVYKRQP